MTTGSYNWNVKSVGIKTLKARLSEYLRLVKAGEKVLITDRDEVVAELVPPRHVSAPHSGIAELLEHLADKGLVQLRSSTSGIHPLVSTPLQHKPTISSQTLLEALRSES